ncbi:hypothetical protein MMC28_009248 [Mycoblastus sanguinarius]|nr:hypothetical protein [Mycoblastus sanguinarius]
MTSNIVQSYRNLYRHALHAVQYSSPARYTLRSLLRNAYRTKTAADFDAEKIKNTLTFLHYAGKEKGLEHRLLKNLLHVWWWEANDRKKQDKTLKSASMKTELSQSTIEHFEITLKMLNESMGMCLPTSLSTEDKPPEVD